MTDAALRAGDRTSAGKVALWVLVPGLILSAVISISTGPAAIPLSELWSALRYWITGSGVEPSSGTQTILVSIRLPRLMMGIIAGGMLAIAGAILQGLFRNPLADPGLIGISTGASIGSILSILLGGGVLASLASPAGAYQLPFFAFAGSLAVTAILHRVSSRRGEVSVPTMLLAGVALAAIGSAIIGIALSVAQEPQLRDNSFWMLGSLSGATWTRVAALLPLVVVVVVIAVFIAGRLNALMLGEEVARYLGVRVERLKRLAMIAVAAAVGAAVAFTGTIAFVGLIVPHLLRMMIGSDHRYLIPASGLSGAILILLLDLVCRMVAPPMELPIGLLTALIGGPLFLWLLLRRQALVAH